MAVVSERRLLLATGSWRATWELSMHRYACDIRRAGLVPLHQPGSVGGERGQGDGEGSYRVGNNIGFVVSQVTHAWTHLSRTMGHTALSAVVSPYMLYNSTTGMFEHLTKNYGFSPTPQMQSLLVAELPALTCSVYDAAVIALPGSLDHAYPHVLFFLLDNLKDIKCNNQLYTLNENHVTEW